MKMSAAALLIWLIMVCAVQAETESSSTSDRMSSMLKRGEVYQLETVAPLIDGPDRVTVLEFGPRNWVLVEYEASVLLPGELLPKPRRGQMWVNFDQVVAARRVGPEAISPATREAEKAPAAKK